MIKKSSLSAILIGNTLEFYDFALYGIYLPFFSRIYFPTLDYNISILSTLAIYAAGFFMRPLGAAFFGHVGDTLGRKKSLTISIIFMAIPTLIIGLLPTYEQIGVFAPFILMLCRLMQGFCAGGELSGAIIYLVEQAPIKRIFFWGSLSAMSGASGALMGSFTAFITISKSVPEWAWRLPFLLSFLLLGVGFYIRQNITETPIFIKYIKQKKINATPMKIVFKEEPFSFFYGILGAGFSGILSSTLVVYFNIYLQKYFHLSNKITTSFVILSLLVYVLWCPIAGWLSDKYQHEKVMRWGILGVIGVMILFILFDKKENLNVFIFIAVMLGISAASYMAPFSAFMTLLFPPSLRYSGSSFAYNLGVTAFGGTMPLISETLCNITNSRVSFCFYIILMSVVCLYFTEKIIKNKILRIS